MHVAARDPDWHAATVYTVNEMKLQPGLDIMLIKNVPVSHLDIEVGENSKSRMHGRNQLEE